MPKSGGGDLPGGGGRKRKRGGGSQGGHAQHGAPGALKQKQEKDYQKAGGYTVTSKGGRYYPPLPDPSVVRQQQILRRAGFSIPVDGINGVRTQQAWKDFLAGINKNTTKILQQRHAIGMAGPNLPEGFTLYRGRTVSNEQAKLLRRLNKVEDTASRLSRVTDAARHITRAGAVARTQRIAEQVRNGQLTVAHPTSRLQAENPAQLERHRQTAVAHARAQAYEREGALQQALKVRQRLNRILGVDDRNLLRDPAYIEHLAASGRLDVSDLAFLDREGYIDYTDRSDVRALQYSINNNTAHTVKVTGVFDNQTAAGMQALGAKIAAAEFKRDIQATRTRWFHDGIGALATHAVFGRILTPAETLAVLRTDTPQARKLSRELVQHYFLWQQDVELTHLREQRAGVLATQQGIDGPLTDQQISDLLASDTASSQSRSQGRFNETVSTGKTDAEIINDRSLRTARTFGELRRGIHAQEQLLLQERIRAHNEPTFWDHFYNDNWNPLDDVVDATGGALGWAYSATSVDEVVSDAVNGYGWLAPRFQAAVLANSSFLATMHGRGDIRQTPAERWEEGIRTRDAIHEKGGWQSLAFDVIADPINLIPTGAVFKGFRFASTATRIGLADSLIKAADITDSLAYRYTGHAIADGIQNRALSTWMFGDTLKSGGWRLATGQTVLGEAVRESAAARLIRIGGTHKAVIERNIRREAASTWYAHISSIGKAAVDEAGVKIDDIPFEGLDTLEDEGLKEAPKAFDLYKANFEAANPEFVAKVRRIGTSLYVSKMRDAGLGRSKVGERLFADAMETARKDHLLRYALLDELTARVDPSDLAKAGFRKHLSTPELLRLHRNLVGEPDWGALAARAGSWKGGGLDPQWAMQLQDDLRLSAKRISEFYLPMLDDFAREGSPGILWKVADNGAEVLDTELDDAIEAAVDGLLGYRLKEAFDPANYQSVRNPTHIADWENSATKGFTDSEKEWLRGEELDRRIRSYQVWADAEVRTGKLTEHAAFEKVANFQADLFKEMEGRWVIHHGYWFDKAEKITVPPITSAFGDGTVAQTFLNSVDRHSAFLHPRNPDEGILLEENPDWVKQVTALHRLEAIHAIYDSRMVSRLQLKNLLLFDFLRDHQTRWYRYLYHGLTFGTRAWKTAVLPGNPGAAARNITDNTVKILMNGVHDPRLFFNSRGQSIFQAVGIRRLRVVTQRFDRQFGTNASGHLDRVLMDFWMQHPRTVQKVFLVHGVPIPFELLEREHTIARLGGDSAISRAEAIENVFTKKIGPVERHATPGAAVSGSDIVRAGSGPRPDWKTLLEDVGTLHHGQSRLSKYHDALWEMMMGSPESAQKRILYASVYRRSIRKGKTETDAAIDALEAVNRSLFDYDQITVFDDFLQQVAFPFFFFWRKNAGFWAHEVIAKPWFFDAMSDVYEAHLDSNADLPNWMRRYVDLSGAVADVVGIIPGVGPALADTIRDAGGKWNFDPLNQASISKFYAAYKLRNPDLPPDEQGWSFLSGILSGFQKVGLGVNPYLRDIAERTGLADRRGWQDIFPQTTFLQALTNIEWVRQTLGVDTPGGWNLEDIIADPIYATLLDDYRAGEDITAQRFEFEVRKMIAQQIARGEAPDRAAAERRVRQIYLTQTMLTYGVGIYTHYISNDEIAIQAISAHAHDLYQEFDEQTASEKLAYYLGTLDPDLVTGWQVYSQAKKRYSDLGYSARAFDSWTNAAIAARPFFQIEDSTEQQQYLEDHPEVLQIINPIVRGDEIVPDEYLRQQSLIARTKTLADTVWTYFDDIDASYSVKNAANDYLITPALSDFWKQNDTPAQIRARQVRAGYYRHIKGIQDAYFAIPETDYDSRSTYLAAHPELRDWWAANDRMSDDYTSIQLAANNTFREIYFRLADAGDWDAANDFLKRHSFIFDFTKSEGRIAPDGHWVPASEAQADYAKVAPALRVYYALAPGLRKAYLLQNPYLKQWFAKYRAPGGLQEHGEDYEKVSSLLAKYFNTPASAREAFLNAHPELKAYFAKYGSSRSDSQHARDYREAKPYLDAFFDLPESERSAYLADHPILQRYFAKWSSGGHGSTGRIHSAIAADPEVARRYDFWTQYFDLPPNKRAQFVHLHAEDYGVFIYGSLAGDYRHRLQGEWHRLALRYGTSDRAAAYMSIKPLMDVYFKLEGAEKELFLQTNPELTAYFEQFGDPFTKDPKLNKLLRQYFRTPGFSQQREEFLLAHPALQKYFNKTADRTPREEAIHRLAEQYFRLPFEKREQFVANHPELGHYFDQRQREADLFASMSAAFNETDPRMKKYFEMYADIIPKDAIHRFFLMLMRGDQVDTFADRADTGRLPDDEQRRQGRELSLL